MRTDELLEQCLQALTSGEDYLRSCPIPCSAPEQRAEIEDLLAIGQRVSRTPPAELSPESRKRMGTRMATRLGLIRPRWMPARPRSHPIKALSRRSPRKSPSLR